MAPEQVTAFADPQTPRRTAKGAPSAPGNAAASLLGLLKRLLTSHGLNVFLKASLQVHNVKLLPMTVVCSCEMCTYTEKIHTWRVCVCAHEPGRVCAHTVTDPLVSLRTVDSSYCAQPFTGSLFLLRGEITNTILELQIEW